VEVERLHPELTEDPMTDERMALVELLQKSGDGDFLRAVAEAVLQILMEADVEGLIGAGRHERTGDRLNYRNGYRELPRSTVDWDTSQADDFRTRGGPWTIKRTVLERGRAPRSDRKSLAQRRPGAAAGCRDSAKRPRCCGCCGARIWKRCRAAWG
jgi:hypothetical protein